MMIKLEDFLAESVSRGKKKDPYIEHITMGMSFHDFLVYINRIGIETKENDASWIDYRDMVMDKWFGLLINDLKYCDTVVVDFMTGCNLIYELNFSHHKLTSIPVFKLPDFTGSKAPRQVHTNLTAQEAIEDIEHRIDRWEHKKR